MTTRLAASLAEVDPLLAGALDDERRRQQTRIELIASENIVSRAVLEALGHEIANKTLEGYPGRRFHGGGRFVDVVDDAREGRFGRRTDGARATVARLCDAFPIHGRR